MYAKLSEQEEYLAKQIVDIAFKIPKTLGPALQILSYLKLTDKRLGFLINFHVPLIKDGIKRIIL
jgi:hypothetical protein